MAGRAKSIYLTIYTKGTLKTVFHKVFFETKSYNEYVKTDEFKAKWPDAELFARHEDDPHAATRAAAEIRKEMP